jgi:hypothetical protein
MNESAEGLQNTFARAWSLLTQNLIIVVPPIVLGAAAGLVGVLLVMFVLGGVLTAGATGRAGVGIASIGASLIVAAASIMLLAIVQTAFVTGMAGAAWERGTTTLGDGWTAFGRRGGQILLTMLVLFAIGCVALVLAPFTLLLSLLAYLIAFIYVPASVIVGGRDAGEALSESVRLTARNFWPTSALAGLIIVIVLIASALGGELGRATPFVGGLTAAILQQAVVAYASLVVVGEYVKLRAA